MFCTNNLESALAAYNIAGMINIFCMTGCVHLYTSKDKNKSDMLWPDMTIWCMWAQVVPLFQLKGTFAAALPRVYGGAAAAGVTTMDLYDKAIGLYNQGRGKTALVGEAVAKLGITADPSMQSLFAMLSLGINVICISVIIRKSIQNKCNPYSHEVFKGTKDYEEALARAEK